jgi:hypothetical protein
MFLYNETDSGQPRTPVDRGRAAIYGRVSRRYQAKRASAGRPILVAFVCDRGCPDLAEALSVVEGAIEGMGTLTFRQGCPTLIAFFAIGWGL